MPDFTPEQYAHFKRVKEAVRAAAVVICDIPTTSGIRLTELDPNWHAIYLDRVSDAMYDAGCQAALEVAETIVEVLQQKPGDAA